MRKGTLRFTGALRALSGVDRGELMRRGVSKDKSDSTRDVVAAIITRITRDGDVAVRELAKELDTVALIDIEVPRELWKAAFDALKPELRRAIERSARNIETFHRSQIPVGSSIIIEPGITLGRRPDPLERVGVYAPRGRAAYPSSVLMGAIPARVAGVGEVILCSPPGSTGLPDGSILASAFISGVDRVFAIGGAGAIAAMSVGTATVPRVEKVVGPGNAYVTEAKLQLASVASFDSPAGPSELLIITDDSANPAILVGEMLAQAEHDPQAAVVVVVVGESRSLEIQEILEAEISSAQRSDIIGRALKERGAVLSAVTLGDAVRFANEFAPEHLMLATRDSSTVLAGVRNAGTVFIGQSSSVAFGDYMTGANHVLPTGGLARSYSGLSTLDFMRWTTFQTITPHAAASLAADVGEFAKAEGLFAHAEAALTWAGDDNEI